MSKKSFKTEMQGIDGLLGDEKAEGTSATSQKESRNRGSKWQEFAKVNTLLKCEQKDFLDKLSKQAMRSRKSGKGKERITANTFLRCLIDVLKERAGKVNLTDIADEKELRKRLSEI